MFEERAPARLVLLGALADAENLPITLAFHPSDTLRTPPAQLRLSAMPCLSQCRTPLSPDQICEKLRTLPLVP